MVFPTREQVEKVRAEYPKGTRVELVSMEDPYSRLKPGDRGMVPEPYLYGGKAVRGLVSSMGRIGYGSWKMT